MSLTRDEWLKMWESVKTIENLANTLKSPPRRQQILWQIKKIKDQIQAVIGQME
ncbi:MAG TPA: hypothetical protein VE971_03860 [Candidatus Eisenbacteria bacterium]|nr:hypothetical protein [Candidatus Eisenbacteria bacterium]